MPTITVESIDSANIHIHSFTSPEFQQALDPGRDTTLDGFIRVQISCLSTFRILETLGIAQF